MKERDLSRYFRAIDEALDELATKQPNHDTVKEKIAAGMAAAGLRRNELAEEALKLKAQEVAKRLALP